MKKISIFIIASCLVFLGILLIQTNVFGAFSFPSQGVKERDIFQHAVLLSATSTISNMATGTPTTIIGAKKVTIYFHRSINGTTATANAVFKVYVSEDGNEYVLYNKLIDNVANSNSQTLTRVASKTLGYSSTTDASFLSMDLQHDSLGFVLVVASSSNSVVSASSTAIIEY